MIIRNNSAVKPEFRQTSSNETLHVLRNPIQFIANVNVLETHSKDAPLPFAVDVKSSGALSKDECTQFIADVNYSDTLSMEHVVFWRAVQKHTAF